MTTLIIGGGWSGLAAAVSLSQQGRPVTVIEAAAQLGGRARDVQWQDLTLDNGQHLMIGAYRALLDMLAVIGVKQDDVFQQTRFDISIIASQYPRLRLSAGNVLPWQLSLASRLLWHNGLSLFLDISRIQGAISRCLQQSDITVEHWLTLTRQSSRSIQQLWEPLCLATLNTPIHEASAHVFATVLNDMFASRAAAQPLIPKVSLGQLFPQQAANFIKHHGGQILLQQRIKKLHTQHDRVTVVETSQGQRIQADNFILATSPTSAQRLLAENSSFRSKDYPITTVYLQYEQQLTLSQPMFGLSGTTAQWVFDRQHDKAGLLAVVISGPGKHEKWSHQQLVDEVYGEVSTLLGITVPLADTKVIREKRATFCCSVATQTMRPGNQTPLRNLFVAGDYTQSDYPATLETAIRSGQQAANLVTQGHN